MMNKTILISFLFLLLSCDAEQRLKPENVGWPFKIVGHTQITGDTKLTVIADPHNHTTCWMVEDLYGHALSISCLRDEK